MKDAASKGPLRSTDWRGASVGPSRSTKPCPRRPNKYEKPLKSSVRSISPAASLAYLSRRILPQLGSLARRSTASPSGPTAIGGRGGGLRRRVHAFLLF